ncbi:hypothetical protein jhhlp_008268 [Lomentospora prolificans]|uniref:FAD-binding PCMH-type domain-containing protein n=1 Tax=Lomentospora prolificans TaxID=41688 RepID=A0A2N3MXJ4_9PEZI|nr:hypothetical protein jhhlp_008268 [Lomentospora prolificans]
MNANGGVVSAAVERVPATSSTSGVEYFDYERLQLTEDVIKDISDQGLAGSDFIGFGDIDDRTTLSNSTCKAFPGDNDWPSGDSWRVLDLLLGGALIKAVPLAAPCYNSWPEERSEEACKAVTADWSQMRTQLLGNTALSNKASINDPTSVMWPLFQGLTCLPTDDPDGNCTLGGYPSYVVNVTNVAQVQLAFNFARYHNLRLNVKNKGRDFNAKSTGAGALSIWTTHLREKIFYPNYSHGSYEGPAFKIGAGVEVEEIYLAADEHDVSVVGGIGRTVGIAGGYSAGGGHSPLIGLYGMAADQILSLEIVLPSGHFVSVDHRNYPDLYWALRGGGGSTYGVVTSMVIKAHPRLPITTLTYTLTSSTAPDIEVFWKGIEAFLGTFVSNADAGQYLYFTLVCEPAPCTPDTCECSLDMHPHWAPNMTRSELEDLNGPFFEKLEDLGIPVHNVTYAEFDALYPAFNATWAPNTEVAGTWAVHAASRLMPRENFQTFEALRRTAKAFRESLEQGGSMISYNFRPAANPGNDNAVTPAWRNTLTHTMLFAPWPPGASPEVINEYSEKLVDLMQLWRDVSPGAGAYMNEADINEPDFAEAFYGDSYDRLYDLKQKYDPWGVLYAATAVGSEDWYLSGQELKYYPTQNGRLCRK